MGSLYFCINCYQEEHMLPGCLDSIRRYNSEAKIVSVDGSYQSFVNQTKKLQAHHIEYNAQAIADQLEKFTSAISTDRTLEILKDYKVDFVILPQKDESGAYKPWPYEYVKRSQYFVGQEGDYYFVIDADERLIGKVDINQLTENAYNVMLKRDEPGVDAYEVMRIFKHQKGMTYHGAHHALWANGILHKKEMFRCFPGVKLDHQATYRTTHDPIRNLAKGAYYRILTSEEEGAFRAQYSL